MLTSSTGSSFDASPVRKRTGAFSSRNSRTSRATSRPSAPAKKNSPMSSSVRLNSRLMSTTASTSPGLTWPPEYRYKATAIATAVENRANPSSRKTNCDWATASSFIVVRRCTSFPASISLPRAFS